MFYNSMNAMNHQYVIVDLAVKSSTEFWNTNGSFARLADGRILFVYNSFMLRTEKQTLARLSAVISSNEGLAWSRPFPFLPEDTDQRFTRTNTSLISLTDGRLLLIYLRGLEDTFLPYMRFSEDGGLRWNAPKPVLLQQNEGSFILRNDCLLRLSSGRLLIPFASHEQNLNADSTSLDRTLNYNGVLGFWVSDDEGASWVDAGNRLSLNVPFTNTGLQEPSVVEPRDGVLWGLARTDLGRQYEFFSMDNARTWTLPDASYFTSSCSPLAMKRSPESDGLLIAVWNPVPSMLSLEHRMRSRLVWAVSGNGGESWSPPVLLEDDVTGSYSHPAIYFTRYGALISYCVLVPRKRINWFIRICAVPYSELRLKAAQSG